MKKLLNEILSYFGLVAVPIKPSKGLLNSMAMRYDHSFGMYDGTDAEIESLRQTNPIIGYLYKTSQEKEVIITQMRQLHEEVVGTGFYREKLEETYSII